MLQVVIVAIIVLSQLTGIAEPVEGDAGIHMSSNIVGILVPIIVFVVIGMLVQLKARAVLAEATKNTSETCARVSSQRQDVLLQFEGSNRKFNITVSNVVQPHVVAPLVAGGVVLATVIGTVVDGAANNPVTALTNSSATLVAFCTKCGRQRAPGAVFCSGCGNKFESE